MNISFLFRTMREYWISVFAIAKRTVFVIVVLVVAFCILYGVFSIRYSERVFPNVVLGTLPVGGLDRAAVDAVLHAQDVQYTETGIILVIRGKHEVIFPDEIRFSLDRAATREKVFAVGRNTDWFAALFERVRSVGKPQQVLPVYHIDLHLLENQIREIALLWDVPYKDIRFLVTGSDVSVLTDTQSGVFIDQQDLIGQVLVRLNLFDHAPIPVILLEQTPTASLDSIPQAIVAAQRILAEPITLSYGNQRFDITQEDIGTWIVSSYRDRQLIPSFDERKISTFVTGIAERINTIPQNVRVVVEHEKVVDFLPPKQGMVLEEGETIRLLTGVLDSRIAGDVVVKEVSLPVSVQEPLIDATALSLGITELVGKATTPFTGSPKNRIANIKNGTKFISGQLVRPGEEFSTIAALGRIDNTTGYLPELVIKGDRTVPEFGGGLCQVSTTLFRAVLHAGLPVLARQNHSYRVSYYEKDGDYNYIGPGLDATIYSPNPDFRFLNDTTHSLLILGYVYEDLLTFELYGTRDGRSSTVDGPRLLSSVSAGEPIYIETDTLPEGETRRIETAHPGGSTVATYTITYPDGRVKSQEFKSYYRRWPAQYLVGAKKRTEESIPTVSLDGVSVEGDVYDN